MPDDQIKTIFGTFTRQSKSRLDLTFDYETCAIRSFRDIAQFISGDTVLDIGANIGVYSVYAADLDCVEKVHAFEPAPAAFKQLKMNVGLQEHSKINCHNVAASSKKAKVQFNVISPMAGNNAIIKGAAKKGSVINVPAYQIDALISVSDQTLCIKVDVEGHEVEALKGAKKLLSQNACFVQVECLRKNVLEELNALFSELEMTKVFSLQHDHLYVSKELTDKIEPMREIIYNNLKHDLNDLMLLRTDKRKLAASAKALWHAAGYRRDPIM